MRSCSEIIVAGFHRSGTSSVTQLLHAAGLFVGDDLIGAMPYNPYGHYEDREVVGIHDQILVDNGLNWQATEEFTPMIGAQRWNQMERLIERRRLAHRLWGFKDPRVCLLLPAWKHLMPDCRVVLVFRAVADCSYSLSRRHAMELFTASGPKNVHRRFFNVPDIAPRMWLAHNRALIAFAHSHPGDVLAVSFESLLLGLPLTTLVRRAWGAPLEDVPTFSALDPLATTRRDYRQPLSDPALAEQLDGVWAELQSLEQQTQAAIADNPRRPAMPADEYFSPTELDPLRMESELLTLENTFLKGRIRTLEQNLKRATAGEARVRELLEREREQAAPKPQ